MSKEAMKLALEAFETLTQYNMVRANIFRRFEPTCTGDYVDLKEFREKAEPAITALREALADQPAQQEPVAWMYPDDYERMTTSETFCTVYSVEVGSATRGESTVALYTSPPTQRKPLTEYQKWRMYEAGPDMPSTAAGVYMRAVDDTEAAHGIKGDT